MDTRVVVGEREEEMGESADVHNLLRKEIELHITEGRVSVQKNQDRVTRIKQLQEQVKKEEKSECNQSGTSTSTMDYEKLLKGRMRLRETHERVIEDELVKMERDLQEQQVGGEEGEMLYVRRERHILVLQIEALRRENQQAYADLESLHAQHQQELNTLKEECLQVFRTFREVVEEQKRVSESRYRSLLLDAVRDAVHLSAQNLQLQEEVQQLRNTLTEQQECFLNHRPPQH